MHKTSRQVRHPNSTGLVLAGGGARGAYEAGVVAGIVEVLGRLPKDRSPFNIFAGTSVGAMNAAFLAAHSDQGDLSVDKLLDFWLGLNLKTHLNPTPFAMMGWSRERFISRLFRRPLDPAQLGASFGRSSLDPKPFETLIREKIPWSRLHENISRGRTSALIVAALHIGSGRTTIFAELEPDSNFRPSKDPHRIASLKPITADHILASAAIPLLFPARRIGKTYYCDGGLRFNTPISPAIRAGAKRLVVVSLMHDPFGGGTASSKLPLPPESGLEQYPSILFLAGKILNAIMLDPVMYDLQMLDRINALVKIFGDTLSTDEMHTLDRVLKTKRGLTYKHVETLVFAPSQNIGALAGEHLRKYLQKHRLTRALSWFLGRAAQEGATWEADLASYLLFDGTFSRTLIELGREDAHRRAEEIHRFFKPNE